MLDFVTTALGGRPWLILVTGCTVTLGAILGNGALAQTPAAANLTAPLPSAQPLPQVVPQPLPAVPPASPGGAAQGEGTYLLGPGDHLSIVVIGYDELNGTRVVLPDGTIAMPLIGSLRVTGNTIDQVSQRLTTDLRQFLVNPVVAVSLAILRPVTVTVIGEVYRPGPVQLSSLTSTSQRVNTDATISAATSTPTLSQALLAAGGVRPTADIQTIAVSRVGPGGRTDTFSINLWESLTNGRVAADLILRDGDAIQVPVAIAGAGLDSQLLARSSFAPDRVLVRVVGEVNQPGEVEVPPDSTVVGAVAIAGGPTREAHLSQVTLIRRNEGTGEFSQQTLDLSQWRETLQVEAGDVIWIPQRPTLAGVDGVDRIFSRIISPLTFINLLQNIGILRRF